MLILNKNDSILQSWKQGTDGIISDTVAYNDYAIDYPVAFRGITKRDVFKSCFENGRDFYYIDTGYLGNFRTFKEYHRVVKNNVQHLNPIDLPSDRFEKLCSKTGNYFYSKKWKNLGDNILVVIPSEKPCKYYNIEQEQWLADTITELKQNTDRKIIIREKPKRQERVGAKSIYNQIIEDNIYAVVTYNSIAATEAVAYGIPAFANAPNAAQSVCSNDFTKIETPYFPEREKVDKWLHWLAYCQYTINEFETGTAYRIQKEYNLC